MLFNSLEFFVFFPAVTLLYFVLPHRFRWAMLLAASCLFYMWFVPYYILILFVTILVDYFAGIWIEEAQGHKRKLFLIVSIISNCAFLFFFKYFNFFNANAAEIAKFLHWNYSIENLKIILPIGLSFHTFQSMSYIIEVYRGEQKTERNFGVYALYVMFYPQLVAGPIERPGNLLHQFHEEHFFDYDRLTDGLKLMLWGLFKKVVIADRLAVFVEQVYKNPSGYEGVSLVVSTVFFAFQIYCDFSGYSDIAIGAAQTMGFKLMDNFNRPYFSKSISEFWKRWHISLSTWFKDYLYIPLGGSRVTTSRLYLNLLIVFLVSGLWHGANWTYVFWGGLNGIYLVGSLLTFKVRRRIAGLTGISHVPFMHKLIQVSITFTLTCYAWIFFRARSLGDAFYIAQHSLTGWGEFLRHFHDGVWFKHHVMLDQSMTEFAVAIAAVVFMEGVHLLQRHGSIRHMLLSRPVWVRWPVYYAMIFMILVFAKTGPDAQQFIYFQF